MTMYRVPFLATLAVAAFLSGCAVMPSKSKIEMKVAAVELPQDFVQVSGVQLRKVLVQDVRIDYFTGRPLADLRQIINKRNGRSEVSEGYFAGPRPVSDFAAESLQGALRRAGVAESATARYEMHARIERLHNDLDGARLGEFIITADVAFAIVDSSTGRVAWSQKIRGKARGRPEAIFVSADDCVKLLPSALADVFKTLLVSPGFRQALVATRVEA